MFTTTALYSIPDFKGVVRQFELGARLGSFNPLYKLWPVFRIRIHMFLGLPDPDPSIVMQK